MIMPSVNAIPEGQVDDPRRVNRERAEAEAVRDEAAVISFVESVDDMVRGSADSAIYSAEISNLDEEDVSLEMGDEELINIIEAELSSGIGYGNGPETNQDRAWEYYLGKPRGDEKEGRSKVISSDVADTVEAMLAQILPSFTTNLFVEFEADNPQDQKTIDEESAYVNWVVQQKSNGFTLFYTLFKDALLSKNCVAKVETEDKTDTNIVVYDDIPRADVQQVIILIQQRLQMQGVDFNDTKAVSVVIDEGDPINPSETVSIRLTVRQRRKEIVISPVPIERTIVNSDHNQISLANARFAAHRDIVMASDLLDMGIPADVVDSLPTCTTDDEESSQRNQTTQEGNIADTTDESTRPIEVFDIVMLVDFDGDGLAERRRVLYAESEILVNEEADHSILASGTPFIQPFRWVGLSLYDKLKQVQDSKTDFLRQAHDNARTANNARIGYVVGQVNPDDIFNSKPSSGIRMRRKDSIVPITTPNVLPAIFEMLGYMDKIRTERGGASLDMQSQQLQVPGDTAHGVERLVSAKEQLASLVSRTFAETVVRDVYLIVHEEARQNITGPSHFKSNGEWKQADPSQWPRRDRINITVGLSQGERQRQASAIGIIIGQQNEQMKNGLDGILVTPEGSYRALVDFAKMAGLATPDKYWVNPRSPESQQAAQQKQQQAQQQEAKMEAQQKQLADMQHDMVRMQEESKRMKTQMDDSFNYAKLAENQRQHTEDIATELTGMEVDAAVDLSGKQKQNKQELE